VYVSTIFLSCLISFIMIIHSGVNQGEFEGRDLLNLSTLDIISTFIFFSFILFFSLSFCYLCNKKKVSRFFGFRLRLIETRVHGILFIILVAQVVFVLTTGVGRLLSNASSPYSPIFFLLEPSVFVILYYLSYRKCAKKIFIVNIILLFVWKISQGWTGIFLILGLCELCYLSTKIKRRKVKVLVVIFAPILVFCLGGAAYTVLYPLKNKIRGIDHGEITYSQGISKLASRLSNLPVALAADNEMEKLSKLFVSDNVVLKEIYAIGRPILPSFLMKDKSFRTLSNNIVEIYYPGITNSTGSNMGLYMYSKVLWISDVIQFFYCFLIIFFITACYKILCDMLEQSPSQLNFMFSLFVIQIVDVSALEMIVGYNFLKFAIFLCFMFIFGCIKLVKIENGVSKWKGHEHEHEHL
ncbi:oligosaccharide repeat unit polymerase, partial [Vibrio cholerae]|uniref:oligosaccharide repeat unit polymerase n=1 Tax=Vibrio cholerae TaxID=666 RepID=UPI00115A3183